MVPSMHQPQGMVLIAVVVPGMVAYPSQRMYVEDADVQQQTVRYDWIVRSDSSLTCVESFLHCEQRPRVDAVLLATQWFGVLIIGGLACVLPERE